MTDKVPESEEMVFVEALQLPPDQRRAFVEQRYAADRDSVDRLLALLRGYVENSEFLERPPMPVSELLLPESNAGDDIGPYRLLEVMGEGGFGVVWLAEQREPVRRRVALKIIKLGMDTKQVVARFEAERQALAMMDHPNIARVFDAGATQSGRPYFAMELAHGVPITRYCDDQRLPIKARLQLFVSVCLAVQHAHQKGVIHRDLKPSNILVTTQDGAPVPKIIDFGIAKATDARLTDKTLVTEHLAFIGTPAYASPEQVAMTGVDVDTRSDIYSLGVVLYELLTGATPVDSEELRQSGLEIMRKMICEGDTLRPSQRLRRFDEERRMTVARQRGTDATRHPILLRGDLEWIALHCLEKDRARRYETASELAVDIRRYLDHEPIGARPPSRVYRLTKLMRRHRWGFAAVAAVIVSLMAGTIVSTSLLLRERAALVRAVEAENAARTAAAKNEQSAKFMKHMLDGVGPSVALGRDTSLLHEIVERTVNRLGAELRDAPEVAADLRETLGVVYRDLGDYAAAEPLLREAVHTHRTLFGDESPRLAASLDHLGDVLRRLNQPAEAAATLQEALAIRRSVFGEQHPAFADTLFNLAQIWRGHAPAAIEEMLEQVLAIRRNAFGAEHLSVAEAIEALGTVARAQLDHERAVELHTEALALYRKLLGEGHPAVARSHDSLGFSLLHIGRDREGMEHLRAAFLLRRKVLSGQHPDLVVALLQYCGAMPVGEVNDEVIQEIQAFVAEQRATLPRNSLLRVPSLLACAALLNQPERDPEQAADLVREARALLDEGQPRGLHGNIEIIDPMGVYGWRRFMIGRPSDGLIMSEVAVELARAAFGSPHPGMFLASNALARIYLATDRIEEAIAQFEETIRIVRVAFPPGHVFLGMNVAGLGAAYREAGRLDDSRRVLEEALDSWKWGKDPTTPSPSSIPGVLCELGLTLNEDARFDEAERVLRESLRCYDLDTMLSTGRRVLPRARAESGLGRALVGLGRFEEAEPLVLRAFEELKRNLADYGGHAHGMLSDARATVIALYAAWGKHDKMAEWQATESSL
jgi:eukaryotic-like serine/threonine-protein kinase